jgi:hypothetical protein
MSTELGQPGGVRDVGLSSREVLHVARVDQHHLEWTVVEQEIEGFPVVTGGFHHDQGYFLGDQMVAQGQDLVGNRAPGCHRRGGSGSPRLLYADADLGVSLRNVKTGAPRMHDVHLSAPSSSSGHCWCPTGEGKKTSEV